MNKTFLSLLSIFLCYSCSAPKKTVKGLTTDSLKIKEVSTNTFVHTSYLQTNDFGNVPCNGMVYFNEDEAIVFDTPTNNTISKQLIHWIENVQKKKITAVVATHFHNDCLGGLEEFHANGTKSYASTKTISLAKKNKVKVLPQEGFTKGLKLIIGKKPVFTSFYGEGHTKDNVVGYIPEENVLFGGCLIKTLNATKGYLGDANVKEWSATVSKIKEEKPGVKIVIPGHGKTGGIELLDYTISLFSTK
ncbi:metallo-beta-lactamase class B [Maribacter vaceletii]|uniref:beta-lactamase n=1 Tax=Maribacter vaceletii TaxID=1206816 RepID=A0A495EBL8_9FLAO|nr:subclass B1 metallo-beta-lactamase [Maribacter vaceletii]RKR14250.1 metallo-beta-lactamase class B [Maribacter vaceletii]